jgi:hypothetical protein
MSTSQRQDEARQLITEILGDNSTHLRVKRVAIEEDLEQQQTTISCEAHEAKSEHPFVIKGSGVGVIDAFFQAMVDRFATEYPSLNTIRFSSFSVQAHLDTKHQAAGTDSEGEVTLQVANSEGKLFRFTHTSRSVIGAAIIATLLALEYFINSERAFVMTYHALKDAKGRNRPDLVQRYTNMMATLVQNTSYSEVISKIRSEIG